MDLSIVIVSYNAVDYLLGTLASIAQHPPTCAYEVFVVDSASSEPVPARVREAYPWVKVIASPENIGFARSNNLALQQAGGRLVLFLNPDTLVHEGSLDGLVAFADAHPQAAAYTCRLINPDGSLQMSCFHFPSLHMAFYGFFPRVPMDSEANGRYPAAAFDTEFAVEHALGACLMLRRDALEAVGGWDGRYFMYFEETDLCYRLTQRGLSTLYTPAVSIVHYGGGTTASVKEKMSVAFYRSQSYFYRKNYPWWRFVALKIIVFFGLGYWAARTLKNYLQRRIDGELFRTRFSGYAKILVA